MKTLIPLLTLIIMSCLEVLAGGNQSTLDPVQAGYTLPIVKTTAGIWVNTNAAPAMMIRPTTNRPAILPPPTGLHIQLG
jgi:hypothetical protein